MSKAFNSQMRTLKFSKEVRGRFARSMQYLDGRDNHANTMIAWAWFADDKIGRAVGVLTYYRIDSALTVITVIIGDRVPSTVNPPDLRTSSSPMSQPPYGIQNDH